MDHKRWRTRKSRHNCDWNCFSADTSLGMQGDAEDMDFTVYILQTDIYVNLYLLYYFLQYQICVLFFYIRQLLFYNILNFNHFFYKK